MYHNGFFEGGAKLTAILKPTISNSENWNYINSRLMISLQYRKYNGSWRHVFYNQNKSKLSKDKKFHEHQKWNPIRHYINEKFKFNTMNQDLRLIAKVINRDNFVSSELDSVETPPQVVSFVLTFQDPDIKNKVDNNVLNETKEESVIAMMQ